MAADRTTSGHDRSTSGSVVNVLICAKLSISTSSNHASGSRGRIAATPNPSSRQKAGVRIVMIARANQSRMDELPVPAALSGAEYVSGSVCPWLRTVMSR